MGLASWYLSMLKKRPTLANMGSAVVLMTTGDIMAQELEHRNIGDRKQEVEITEEKIVSLKRYYTVNSKVAESHAEKKYERTKNRHKHAKDEKVIFQAEKRKDLFTQAKESIHATVDTLQAEIEFLDGYRTATMIVWSAGIFTPLYVQIFKLMDWSMPHKTPVTVAARVILSFLISIPLNTAFFTYGTFVHHTAEWLAIKDEWNVHLQDMGVSLETTEQYGSVIPFDWEMMVATAKLKLESELYTTIRDSAKAWIPINTLNFTVMPPHLRPLILLGFGVFWNAYLSLAQHRDLSLPEDE